MMSFGKADSHNVKDNSKDGDKSREAKTNAIRKSKAGGQTMRSLTREECDRMMAYGFVGRNRERDQAYFATGLYLGARVDELLSIHREAVYDYATGKIRPMLYLARGKMKGSGKSVKNKKRKHGGDDGTNERAAKRAAPPASGLPVLPTSLLASEAEPDAVVAPPHIAHSAPATMDTDSDNDVPPLIALPKAGAAKLISSATSSPLLGPSADSDEIKALKQRLAQFEQRERDHKQAEAEVPKTRLELKLAAENAAMKSQIAEEEAFREKRRRKTPPARIPIPPKLHPFLLPLCVDKDPDGPLFVSERRTADGEEKAPDSDTMLKMIRAAAKRAGLDDWEHVGNHSLKHTFTKAGQAALGGDLAKLKKMTRHRSFNALLEYLKPNESEIQNAFLSLDMVSPGPGAAAQAHQIQQQAQTVCVGPATSNSTSTSASGSAALLLLSGVADADERQKLRYPQKAPDALTSGSAPDARTPVVGPRTSPFHLALPLAPPPTGAALRPLLVPDADDIPPLERVPVPQAKRANSLALGQPLRHLSAPHTAVVDACPVDASLPEHPDAASN